MLSVSVSTLFAVLVALCPHHPAPADPAHFTAAPAPADHRRCVTVHEYRSVHVGDPARKVRRIWDGYGFLDESGAHAYPYCRGGYAVVGFEGVPSLLGLKYRLGPSADPFG